VKVAQNVKQKIEEVMENKNIKRNVNVNPQARREKMKTLVTVITVNQVTVKEIKVTKIKKKMILKK
jgi:undecaprenyl pyrophosphate synthase